VRVGVSVGRCIVMGLKNERVLAVGDVVNIALRIAVNDALTPGKAFADQDVVKLCATLSFKQVDESPRIFELA
jgi:class 3 adenylate cyclase